MKKIPGGLSSAVNYDVTVAWRGHFSSGPLILPTLPYYMLTESKIESFAKLVFKVTPPIQSYPS